MSAWLITKKIGYVSSGGNSTTKDTFKDGSYPGSIILFLFIMKTSSSSMQSWNLY